jgi:E3 ubiquitin-protein ligase DOA10
MCSGTMKTIHVDCLREWLNSKRSKKAGNNITTYCWKQIECELCKMRLPFTVRHKGQVIDLLDFEKPKQPYYVLESVT